MTNAQPIRKAPRSWPLHWDDLSVSSDAAAQHAMLALARKRVRTMRAAVAETGRVAGLRKGKRMSRRYMRSDTARLVAAAEAYERKKGSLVDADGSAIKQVVDAIRLTNPWKTAHQRLVAVPRQKHDGEDRWVYMAGFVDHAVQRLTKEAVNALVTPEPTQFMSSGGRRAFEEWLRAELPGSQLVITTDIPKCFEAALRVGVEDSLPLPRRVQKAVLFDPKDQALFLERTPWGLRPTTRANVANVSEVGRGIPQGTASASVVSEALIGPILKAVTSVHPDVMAASYGDNLIIILKSADQRLPAIQALMSAVEARFGTDVIGPLTSRTRTTAPKRGFSFCGRFYRLSKNKVRVTLDEQRLHKWAIKIGVRISDFQRSKDPAEWENIRLRIVGWERQNGGLAGVFETAHHMLCELERIDPARTISGEPSGSDEVSLVGDYDEPDQFDQPWVEAL